MTSTLINNLFAIHDKSFGEAGVKIKIYQDKYKKQYDKKFKVKKFCLKQGDRIQIKRLRSKKAKGGKTKLNWLPRNSYYTIFKINKRRKTVVVKNKKGYILKRHFNFDYIRSFHG